MSEEVGSLDWFNKRTEEVMRLAQRRRKSDVQAALMQIYDAGRKQIKKNCEDAMYLGIKRLMDSL